MLAKSAHNKNNTKIDSDNLMKLTYLLATTTTRAVLSMTAMMCMALHSISHRGHGFVRPRCNFIQMNHRCLSWLSTCTIQRILAGLHRYEYAIMMSKSDYSQFKDIEIPMDR
jgi:hypothetical protein